MSSLKELVVDVCVQRRAGGQTAQFDPTGMGQLGSSRAKYKREWQTAEARCVARAAARCAAAWS